MGIALEFIDFVVPIAVIRYKYPGGWSQCTRDHATLVGGRVWYDSYLFRDGAMNPSEVKLLVDQCAKLGFEVMASRDRKQICKDVCVVEAIFGGPTLPCDWLTTNASERIAYLKGTPPGPVVGRGDMSAGKDAYN